MYLRETKRRNRDGSTVSYLQLAHSERHPVTGVPSAKVIHNFGRAEAVDRDALARLVASISRFLDPQQAITAAHAGEIEVLDSRRFGGAWLLDQLWERLGIGAALHRVAADRRLDADATERVLFALVAQRALEPGSKLAATGWVGRTGRDRRLRRVFRRRGVPGDGLPARRAGRDRRGDLRLGRAPAEPRCRHRLRRHHLHLLGGRRRRRAGRPAARTRGRRRRLQAGRVRGSPVRQVQGPPRRPAAGGDRDGGHPRRDPGALLDISRQRERPADHPHGQGRPRVRGTCTGWCGSPTRGFASAANRAYLTRGGGHYIHAEKLRHTNAEAAAALARPGRYHDVADNLRVKEVAGRTRVAAIGDGARAERFVVCHNPDAADRDAAVRQRLIEHLQGLIDGSDTWPNDARDELVGSLQEQARAAPLLRRTTTGLLRIDRAAAAREAHYDGKWLLRTSDLTLTAEDLAAAYKQLLAVERGWRDCKSSLGLRPVYHHREDRIRAHVQLCWLALLLIRVAETAHRRHLAQPAPRTRPHAPGHPRHRRRPRRPTLRHHQRPEDHPGRARPARTAQVPRLHTLRSPRGRLTAPPTPRGCSNTTQTGSSRVCTGQRRNPAIRVPTICGSQESPRRTIAAHYNRERNAMRRSRTASARRSSVTTSASLARTRPRRSLARVCSPALTIR